MISELSELIEEIFILTFFFLLSTLISYFYFRSKKSHLFLKLTHIQTLTNSFSILTFVHASKKIKNLSLTQTVSIRLGFHEGVFYDYIPFKVNSDSIQFLMKTDRNTNDRQCCYQEIALNFWKNICLGDMIPVTFPKQNFKYEGKSQLKAFYYDNKMMRRKFKQIYLICEGSKIALGLKLAEELNKQRLEERPFLNILVLNEFDEGSKIRMLFSELLHNNAKLKIQFANSGPAQLILSKRLKQWKIGNILDSFFLIGIEDLCQTVVCQKYLESIRINEKQIFSI